MIHIKKTLFVPMIILAVLLASCAGKPQPKPVEEPVPVQPAPAPEVKPAPEFPQAELDALMSQVLAAKQKAFDYKLFEITEFAEPYKTANNTYADGKTAYDAKDGPAAKDKLTTALGLFNDLNAKGIPKRAELSRSGASDLKATALKAQADSLAADRFGSGEKAFATASAAFEAKNYEAAIASFDRASLLYGIANLRAQASALRTSIGKNGYDSYDTGNYQTAENKYAAEDKAFTGIGAEAAALPATDPKALSSGKDALEEAVLRYNLVITAGRKGICLGKQQKTDASIQKARDIKAQVATKDEFNAAMAIYNEAGSLAAKGEYEKAGDKFESAAKAFDQVYVLAAEKRAAAEKAMREAAAAEESSLKKAQDAEPTVIESGVELSPTANGTTDTTAPSTGTTK